MSYTDSTTHYGLPLPKGSDKSLFTDTNQAFQDIDAAIYTAETVSSSAATDITAIKATIVNLQNADITFQNDITSLKGRMTAVEGVAAQNTTDIADVRSDAEDMITAHNEPTATSAHAYAIGDEFIYNDVLYRATAAIAIGDTIVPNTNCAATNVMTEVNQLNNDIVDLHQLFTDCDVYVDGDGVSTTSAKLDALYALIDTSKLTANSKFVYASTSYNGASLLGVVTGGTIAAHVVIEGHMDEFNIKTTGSTSSRFNFSDGSVTDRSTSVVAVDVRMGVIY